MSQRSTRPKHQLRVVGAVVVALLVALLVALPVAGNPEESFKKGVAAAELGRFAEAADWLRRAIAEDPRESEKRVFISGVFSRPYLPQYYLGWALVQAGEEHCSEALGVWAESTRQGVIKKFGRQAADLRQSSEKCMKVVLPDALKKAEAAIAEAALAAGQMSRALASSGEETERRAALAQLEKAKRTLEEGRSSGSFEQARVAEDLAEQAGERLRGVAARTAESRARELAEAAATSRRALVDARQAERALRDRLAEPRLVAARQRDPEKYRDLAVPKDLDSRLGSLQVRLDTADDLAAFDQIEQDAKRLTTEMKDLAARAFTQISELQAPARPAPRESPVVDQPAFDAEPPVIAETRQREPEPGPTFEALEKGLVEAAEALLARLETETDSDLAASRLLTSQRARLGALVVTARGWTGEPSEIELQLTQSYTALQIVAGAEALFGGRAADAAEILSARALPASRLGAQGLMLRAAALVALSRLDESQSAPLRQRAERDIRRARALDGTQVPGSRAFSALYRQRYDASAPN